MPRRRYTSRRVFLSPSTRRYDDDEVRRILDHAVRRQNRSEETGLVGEGDPTLADLRAIAREAGIDPRHVEAAALELYGSGAAPATSPRDPVWFPHEVRDVGGASLAHGRFEAVVAEMRKTFKVNGIVTDFGEAREWCSVNALGSSPPVRLRLSVHEGGAAFTLSRDLSHLRNTPLLMGAIFGLVGVLLSLILLMVGAPAPAVALGASWLAAGGVIAAVGSGIARRMRKERSRALTLTANRIEAILIHGGREEPAP